MQPVQTFFCEFTAVFIFLKHKTAKTPKSIPNGKTIVSNTLTPKNGNAIIIIKEANTFVKNKRDVFWKGLDKFVSFIVVPKRHF